MFLPFHVEHWGQLCEGFFLSMAGNMIYFTSLWHEAVATRLSCGGRNVTNWYLCQLLFRVWRCCRSTQPGGNHTHNPLPGSLVKSEYHSKVAPFQLAEEPRRSPRKSTIGTTRTPRSWRSGVFSPLLLIDCPRRHRRTLTIWHPQGRRT